MKHEHETLEKITGAVGKPVSFRFPGGEGTKKGILKDRAIVPSNPGTDGIPYWDVIDLIEFPEEAEPYWIRIGYYRMSKGRLNWGSQTTITEPVDVWKRVLIDAAKQKAWFRTLLRDVMRELYI
jgi:hypothetical protein